eukprot:TRINITY_DN8976_c0_g1_i1.p1 TRINITY_DN8976_c0_g1~~TRINITY_DN8976_c0_g1_i1.p1  ORF type:complete len:451 (+),score=87.46 TRINITY_DN8976_c0_g1_i1:107-1459(+)
MQFELKKKEQHPNVIEFSPHPNFHVILQCQQERVVLYISKLVFYRNFDDPPLRFALREDEHTCDLSLTFQDSPKLSLFLDIVYILYKRPLDPATSHEKFYDIIQLASEYHCAKVIQRCSKHLLSKDSPTVEVALKYLDFPEYVRSCRGTSQFITEMAKIVIKHFPTILQDDKRFNLIKANAMEELLKHDDLDVDSEGTLLIHLLVWGVCCNDESRVEALGEKLLDHIRFIQIDKYFLLHVVPLLASLLASSPKGAKAAEKLLSFRQIGIQYHIGGANRFTHGGKTHVPFECKNLKLPKRKSAERNPSLVFVEEISIPTLAEAAEKGAKVNTNQRLHGGYCFYTFLVLDIPTSTVQAYVRCTCTLVRLENHFLPVEIEVSDSVQNIESKKLRVIFQKHNEALGGISLGSLESLTAHAHKTLTLTTKITILKDDSDCQLLNTYSNLEVEAGL